MQSIKLLVLVSMLIGIFLHSEKSYSKESLVVAFSLLPPWKVINSGQFEGAYAELIRELAKKLNMQIEFNKCPLKRCLKMMEDGTADIIIGINDHSERKKYIQFINTPIKMSTAKVFYLKKGGRHTIQKYEDLKKLKVIGTKLGAKYFTQFDNDTELHKYPVTDNTQILLMLILDRIDAVAISEDQGEYLISMLRIRGEVEKAIYSHKDYSPRYIGISKKSHYFSKIDKIESAMNQISESGRLDEIM